MSGVPELSRRGWRSWTVVLPASLALCAAFVLGTAGWFVNAFGIGSNCTDKFDCGSGSCAPCAAALAWVDAGPIGQLVVAAAAAAMLALGTHLPELRRPAAIAAFPASPLAVAWYAISTAAAQHSF